MSSVAHASYHALRFLGHPLIPPLTPLLPCNYIKRAKGYYIIEQSIVNDSSVYPFVSNLRRHHNVTTPNTVSRRVAKLGAAHGIGFAIAQLLANSGARVVIADIDEDIGKEAERKIGHGAVFIRCDVTSWADQIHLFQHTVATFSLIDLVVCNAGINPELMPSHSSKYDYLANEYEENNAELLRSPSTKMFDVNTTGIIYNIKLALHHMIPKGGGRIVVIGSAASYIPFPEQALYCASKHAVLGLVRATSLRKECLENRVSISTVAPWLTQTRMTQELFGHLPASISVSSPQDVASAVAIIATQPLDKVHGKSLWVQGETCTEVEDVITECHTKLIL
jgi:NAD(P)-dependent dehydrogenase (short-subunit alcohol dehydrogenase family)